MRNVLLRCRGFLIPLLVIAAVAIIAARYWDDPHSDKLVFFATILLVMATLILWVETKSGAERQLRAYISVLPNDVKYDSATKTFTARVQQKNCGKTPARRVRFDCTVRLTNRTDVETAQPNFLQQNPSRNIVFPDQKFSTQHELDQKRSIEDVRNDISNGMVITVFARAEYYDIYGFRHTTTARWYYEKLELELKEDATDWINADFTFTTDHNDGT